MAGHSHASNVQVRKDKVDSIRTKLYTKLGRELQSAAKGNANPETNSKLAWTIKKVKAMGLPKENIERALKAASGDKSGRISEPVTFEAKWKSIFCVIRCDTDNKNRTSADLKSLIRKHNASVLPPDGAGFKFVRRGVIVFDRPESGESRETELLELALECGGDDVLVKETEYFMLTEPDDFMEVNNKIIDRIGTIKDSFLGLVPIEESVSLEGEDIENFVKFLESLEEYPDVEDVFHNANLKSA